MNRFTTTIKTNYTNKQVPENNREFVTQYSSKTSRKIITGDNRAEKKRYASRLIE